MILPKEKLDKLSPSYRKEVWKLEQALSLAKTIREKINLIGNFTWNFLTLKEFWDEWFRLFNHTRQCFRYDWELKTIMEEKRLFHFGFNQSDPYDHVFFPYPCHRLFQNNQQFDEILVPHKNLFRSFLYAKQFSPIPMGKSDYEKCEKMKNLYWAIQKEQNSNIMAWFNLILESNNVEFVIKNAEYMISNNVDCFQLWRIYIKFLKDHDQERMLSVFSRYCRYFMNDLEGKRRYMEAVEEYGARSRVSWENAFDFEEYERERTPSPDYCAMSPPPDEFDEKPIFIEPCFKGSFGNFGMQEFSLPKTTVSYMMKSSKSHASVLHKFHKSCKYFFVKIQTPVCHRFLCHDQRYTGIEFAGQSLGIYLAHIKENQKLVFENQLILSNALDLGEDGIYYGTYPMCRNYLSTIILPNISHSCIKFLHLRQQDLSFDEFIFLVAEKQLEGLTFLNVKIGFSDSAEPIILLEEILEFTPKIMQIKIQMSELTFNVEKVLAPRKFQNKIKNFDIGIQEMMDPIAFSTFINNHFSDESIIRICFYRRGKVAIRAEEKELFHKACSKEIKIKWKTDNINAGFSVC